MTRNRLRRQGAERRHSESREYLGRMEALERRVLLSGQIFVTEGTGPVGEYTASGATVNASLISGLSYPLGIVNVGSDLFIADNSLGTVGEYTTSGTTINASLVSGLNQPDGIAISGSDIFVANSGDGTVGEYTTSGATINASLISGLNYVDGVAVVGSDLFVSSFNLASPGDSGTIGEYTTSGATVNASLVTGLTAPQGIAASGSDLFVTELSYPAYVGSVGEYTTSGATVNAALITGAEDDALGITVSGSDLFLTNNGNGAVGEYTTSGATVNAALISGLPDPQGIWVTENTVASPSAPTDVVASMGTVPHHVALTWAAVSGATSYQVYRSTQDNFSIANKVAGGVTTNSYNDLNVAADGVIHYYWIVARNSTGVGPESADAVGYVPLQAPAVTVTDGAHHVGLTWAAVTNATSYQVWRATTDNVADATRIGNNITDDFFDDTTAASGTQYFYFVRAKNAATGTGLWSTGESGELS